MTVGPNLLRFPSGTSFVPVSVRAAAGFHIVSCVVVVEGKKEDSQSDCYWFRYS